MASADSLDDRAAAKALGFRTFRVTNDVSDKVAGEFICPASKEAGMKTTCDQCKACGGLGSKAKADAVIQVHGAASKVNAAIRRAA
jgi:RecJ-like exonuclease